MSPGTMLSEQTENRMDLLRFSNMLLEGKDDKAPLKWLPVERKVGEEMMLVHVPSHPIIKHWLSVLRNELSPTPIFRGALAELGRFLIYEAARDWIITIKGEVHAPCGVANIEYIDPGEPVMVVPILRAGLVLVEHVSSVLPSTHTYHIGFVRDESILQPTLYLNKLPDKFPDGVRVLIADPVLSTGGTLIATIDLLKQRNVDHRLIRVVSAIAAPSALNQLSRRFPGLKIYTGSVDESVNEKGFISQLLKQKQKQKQILFKVSNFLTSLLFSDRDVIPGIGDAGDRSYGTESFPA